MNKNSIINILIIVLDELSIHFFKFEIINFIDMYKKYKFGKSIELKMSKIFEGQK